MSEALKEFEKELESKSFKGYWQNQQGDVNREPVPSFDSCLWKGKDLFAAMEKAGDVESSAEKRHDADAGVESAIAQAGRKRFVTSPHGRRDSLHPQGARHPADRRRGIF